MVTHVIEFMEALSLKTNCSVTKYYVPTFATTTSQVFNLGNWYYESSHIILVEYF